ncbi:MAG TPA: hypothetical protein VMW89_01190 [Desulfatiglandales bacterium]|nr:hypothetical protein [Desulfatiglandales bacterium]
MVNTKTPLKVVSIVGAVLLLLMSSAEGRIKMVALPERGKTIIRLDNPQATLIEEERVLTLQKGPNQVDFSWKGVSIDADSIRLTVLSNPDKVNLLSVSYPPNEAALVWEISSVDASEVTVRISYLLSFIDRLTTYKAVADKKETKVNLKSFLVLRNFSGEDFDNASVLLGSGQSSEESISHEETKQLLFLDRDGVPIEKIWTFDAGKLPWDPEKIDTNVGIPVIYRIKNATTASLGQFALSEGKVRVFQEDGYESTIFLGEDATTVVPVGEDMDVYIGDSRDIVVTQRKMRDERINVRRNKKNQVALYDTDELIKATIENFKDRPARLTMIQHIPGQWDMEESTLPYKRKDASTLEFEIALPGHGKTELSMHFHRRNVRP